MAEASALNQNAIVRIWRAFGLKPHLRENFKPSTDPLFVEKVRDIVGLDLNPPGGDRRGVFRSVDELTAAINDYIENNSGDPKPLVWTATAELIPARVN